MKNQQIRIINLSLYSSQKVYINKSELECEANETETKEKKRLK